MKPIFTTERLLCRPCVPEDARDYFALFSLPEIARYDEFTPITYAEACADVASHAACAVDTPEVWQEWVLARQADHAFVGMMALCEEEDGNRGCEIGFHLYPSMQGQGYASEAVRGLLKRQFARGVHRVFARVDTRNLPSLRLLERLGFRREGHLVEASLVQGQWADEYLYALLAREWQSN